MADWNLMNGSTESIEESSFFCCFVAAGALDDYEYSTLVLVLTVAVVVTLPPLGAEYPCCRRREEVEVDAFSLPPSSFGHSACRPSTLVETEKDSRVRPLRGLFLVAPVLEELLELLLLLALRIFTRADCGLDFGRPAL